MTRSTAIVTGGAGFIGSHLVDALLAEGRRVVVVDDLSTGLERRLASEADLEVLDIVDRDALERLVDRADPAAVYHLAAQASVTASVDDPGRDCAVNVQGTLHVLEAARRRDAPVVFTSTGGALYGNEAPIPTSEEFIPAPLAPYGASKWAAEAYVVTWSALAGAPHSVCRLGNVYGPRQTPHGEAGVVAIFSHRLWSGQAPMVYGHGRATRDYVHVSDVVEALVRATGRAGTFNVATGVETEVIAVFERLRAASGAAVEPVLAPLRPGELERSCLDARRAESTLGWSARVGLEEGLDSTYPALVAEFGGDAAAAARTPGEA
jgi:UDP-glucose 4-epimerase